MDHAWNALKAGDPSAVEIACGAGAVLACPGITGRLFLRLAGDTVSRVDAEMARAPAPAGGAFYNVGGCSLWPAPEGGAFGFNYPNGADWQVQEGVNTVPYRVAERGGAAVLLEKTVTLVNRKGAAFPVVFRRLVTASLPPGADGVAAAATGYAVQDVFIPAGDVAVADVLAAPWTLEQFPLAPGMEIFVHAAPGWRANWDYYPAPADRGRYAGGLFRKALADPEKWQLGVPDSAGATLLGALDRTRGLMLLRRCVPAAGMRFDFADNDQPHGPRAAADRYSVFYGADAGFFELETVGAMGVVGDRMGVSALSSATWALQGDPDRLEAYAARLARTPFEG